MASMITFFEDKQKLQVQSLKEAIYLETYEVSNFKLFHTILTGVKQKQQVLYIGEMSEPVGQTRTIGACAMPTGIGTISTSEKIWTPVEWGEKRGFCADEWKDYISQYALKTGIDNFDMTDTDMMDIIIDRIAKELVTSHWMKAWFGDLKIGWYGGSPVGDLLAAKYIPFFNTFDGYFAQMLDYTATDAVTALQEIEILGNAEASFAAQKAWGTTASSDPRVVAMGGGNKALEIALKIDMDTPTFIRQQAGNEALCTRLFFNALKINFIGKGLESLLTKLENGIETLSVMGINYTPVDTWDYIIQKFLHNTVKYKDPYRIVLTPKDNLQYGTSGTGMLEKDVRTWVNHDENKTYLQFADETDAKVAMNNKFIIAI